MYTRQSRNRILNIFQIYRSRGEELSIGLTAKYLSDRAFDYLLYPFVIFKFGILKGGIVMTLLAFLANMLTMKFYDWSKRDWLGIEVIKDLKTYSGNRMIGRFTAWILQRSDSMIFLFLSLQYDIPEQTEPPFRRKPNPDSGASRTPWVGKLSREDTGTGSPLM